MTKEEALERLRKSAYTDDLETTLYVSILEEALVKQIPAELVVGNWKHAWENNHHLQCPTCKRSITMQGCKKPNMKFCPKCGQALKWE